MASYNSNVKNTSELITLFTSYEKPKKRPLEHSSRDPTSLNPPKRFKVDNRFNDIKCFICGKSGHTRAQCFKKDTTGVKNDVHSREQRQQTDNYFTKFCTHCKKPGHTDSICRYKPKKDSNNFEKEVNFLGQPN